MTWSTTLRVLSAAAAAIGLLLSTGSAGAQGRNTVDLVLVLALDVSGSVDQAEFALQRDGLTAAILNNRVIEAIARGPEGKIAVAVIQWAGLNEQSVSVPWSIISDRPSATRFARQLARAPRKFREGGTHIAGVIRFATQLTTRAPASALRRVIDISGDGIDNVQYSPLGARDAAKRLGITINGLTILNEEKTLDAYYEANVIVGPNAFVLAAQNYRDYSDAMLLKLLREIDLRFAAGVPAHRKRSRRLQLADTE